MEGPFQHHRLLAVKRKTNHKTWYAGTAPRIIPSEETEAPQEGSPAPPPAYDTTIPTPTKSSHARTKTRSRAGSTHPPTGTFPIPKARSFFAAMQLSSSRLHLNGMLQKKGSSKRAGLPPDQPPPRPGTADDKRLKALEEQRKEEEVEDKRRMDAGGGLGRRTHSLVGQRSLLAWEVVREGDEEKRGGMTARELHTKSTDENKGLEFVAWGRPSPSRYVGGDEEGRFLQVGEGMWGEDLVERGIYGVVLEVDDGDKPRKRRKLWPAHRPVTRSMTLTIEREGETKKRQTRSMTRKRVEEEKKRKR